MLNEIFYILTYSASLPGTGAKEAAAWGQCRQAVSSTSDIQGDTQMLDHEGRILFREMTGHDIDDLAYAAYIYPLVTQQVSTNLFHDLKIGIDDRTFIRPEVDWGWGPTNSGVSSNVVLVIKF
jgi:hypothetical protein